MGAGARTIFKKEEREGTKRKETRKR